MNQRINSIDALRGFCLLNIFINHITLGVLSRASPSKFAFFDSADVFVFLAGISTYFAYALRGKGISGGVDVQRILRRAFVIFWFNAGIVIISLAIALAFKAIAPLPDAKFSASSLIGSQAALAYLADLLTMRQSIGFSMVLRLYVLLMIVAPLYVWLAKMRFWYPLIPAGLIWLIAGHFGLAERDSLTGIPLTMTFLPWNLVFAAGIGFGAGVRQGIAAPKSSLLVFAALVVAVASTTMLTVGNYYSPGLAGWIEGRNDHFWSGASKSLQSPLRVLNLLAVVYLFTVCAGWPVFRLFHACRPDNILCRLGRHSLTVFSLGAVTAYLIDHLMWLLISRETIFAGGLSALLTEIALVAAGIALMIKAADRNVRKPAIAASAA